MGRTGHLFDSRGRRHQRANPLQPRRKMRLRTSITFFWLDPISSSPKACLPPKDRFHIVVELVPPPVVLCLILQFAWINEFFDFLRKVFVSLRVGIGIAFRDFWYRRNIVWPNEWHWF